MIWEILPGKLYQSDLISAWSEELHGKFDLVIDCTHTLDWPASEKALLRFPFDDADWLPNMERLGRVIMASRAWLTGEAPMRVLTHCVEGKNRSSFVNALILLALSEGSDDRLKLVANGHDAINFIREKRPGALTNQTFVRHLESL